MINHFNRRELLSAGGAATVAVSLGSMGTAPARGETAALTLFHNVNLVDGTGAPPRLADVLVSGDRIASVAAPSALPGKFRGRIIKGEGRVLSPGFIDTHTHGDPLEQSYASFLAMGVTTITLGQDGSGPRIVDEDESANAVDLRKWMDKVETAEIDINVATLSGHGSIRRLTGVLDSVRQPDDAALARMCAQLEAELSAGSFGLSYGLEYVPGIYAEPPEMAPLGEVAGRFNAVVMSHMRSENDEDIEESIEELITSALPARPHISHFKVLFAKGEARGRMLLDFLAKKRGGGIELTADAYPYTAGYTGIAILFPEWALPPVDYAQVLATRKQELRDYIEKRVIRRGGPDALLFGTEPYTGKTLAQAAQEAGMAFPDFLVKIGPNGGAGAHFFMDEALQLPLLLDPHVAISTDGAPGVRHPRSTGTYARWIEKYVVADRRLPMEEAIRKASSLPAHILRLPDRGIVRPGAAADLVLFDPANVKARSTYVDPLATALGFDLVMTNGVVAFEGGERIAKAGRLMRAKHITRKDNK